MPLTIQINFNTTYAPAFDIETYIKHVSHKKNITNAYFEFTFVDDDFMVSLHKTHFNLPTRTDIITFNLESIQSPHGDIYICVNDAERHAKELKKTLDDEIKILIIHGILHCLGYNDISNHDRNIMFLEQTNLFNQLEST